MNYEERKNQVKSFLGKMVRIKIDRPVGYVHKKESYSLTYPINYGYIPDVIGGDDEELDVYLLGVNEPVDEYTARIIGIAHRENDVEDKLIAAPVHVVFTDEEVEQAIAFQEQYYDTYIELLPIKQYKCTVSNGKITGLSESFFKRHKIWILTHINKNRYILLSREQFEEKFKNIPDEKKTPSFLSSVYMMVEEIEDENDLVNVILNHSNRFEETIPSGSTFGLEITDYCINTEIAVKEIR